MNVRELQARDFRSYERVEIELGEQLTVITGDNGAGKTNLLEAVYMACVGRSCRTKVDTQTIRFDQPVARVEVHGVELSGEEHSTAVAIDRKEGKTFFADNARVETLEPFEWRPLTTVFMPDRLELVKGAPGARRAHIDQLIAALWPARRINRKNYASALAQRNALLARGGGTQLDVWDRELAINGLLLIEDRRRAVDAIVESFSELAGELGLTDDPTMTYRTVRDADDEETFVERLREKRGDDLTRGFTTFGPHRDEFLFKQGGREVRTYGSQGQQRLTLLALLLAECEAITAITDRRPLVLLDDVMSELDATRRALLVERASSFGQVVITTTEAEHVPGGSNAGRVIAVADGRAQAVI